MERIFVDTAGWYALLNERDSSHEEVKRFLKETALHLTSSNFIVAELLNLLVARRKKEIALQFGRSLRKELGVTLFPIEPADEEEAWRLFEKYKDHEFSFTDCTSFALMNRLRIDRVLTLDEDFIQMGFKVVP